MSVADRFDRARMIAERSLDSTVPGSTEWAQRVLTYTLVGSPLSAVTSYEQMHAPFVFTEELVELLSICGEGREGYSGGTHDMFEMVVLQSIPDSMSSKELLSSPMAELDMPESLVSFAYAGRTLYMAEIYRERSACSPVWEYGIEDRSVARLTDSISEFLTVCNQVTEAWKLADDEIDVYDVLGQPAPDRWIRIDDKTQWPPDWH